MKIEPALKIPFMTKVKLCWEIVTTGTVWQYAQRDMNQYIFRKGYAAGYMSTRAEGEYLVKVFVPTIAEPDEFLFDDLQQAVNFANSTNDRCSEPYDGGTYAELEQTYLNRDLSHLLG